MNHPETQAMLSSFVGAVMTREEVDTLLNLTKETVKIWPDLLPGQVQNAMQWRSEGNI